MESKQFKTNDDLFTCHSLKLFLFLKGNGFYYLYKEKEQGNEKYYYWIFDRTSELMEAVTFFTNNKNKIN